ncbi:MAG: oligosaccharide flippase family protein [Lachnospiraceae bacterium]
MSQKSKDFEKGSLVLFVFIMACNIINYFFQIVTGRLLDDVILYGTMNAMLSVLNLVSLPVAVITLVVSKYAAELNVTDDKGEIKFFIKKAIQYILVIVLVVIIFGIILSAPIAEYMHIEQVSLLIVIIAGAAISYLIQIATGFFQGTKKFISYGIYNLVAPVIKTLLCILFAFLGYKLFGIVIAIFLSNFFAAVLGILWINKNLTGEYEKKISIQKKEILSFSYSAILLNVGITLLNNVDMLLIKHYFADDAGYYSAASVLGKLILYFTNVIVVVLFPFVVEESHDKKKTFVLLQKSLLYGIILAFLSSFLLNLGSGFAIKKMFGDTYLGAVEFILPISIFVTALSILTIIANHDLAREKGNFVIISMILATLLDIVLIKIFHENILIDVWILTGVMIIVTLINLIRVLAGYKVDYE